MSVPCDGKTVVTVGSVAGFCSGCASNVSVVVSESDGVSELPVYSGPVSPLILAPERLFPERLVPESEFPDRVSQVRVVSDAVLSVLVLVSGASTLL